MTDTSPAAERDLLDLIFTPAIDGQTYLNLLYLLLAFPLGIFYFVFLVTGLSTGMGLLIIYVGIPLLIGVLMAGRGLGSFERIMARTMLGVNIPKPSPMPTSAGLLGQFKSLFTDSVTWKSLAYLGLKFPFGIAVFSVLVTSFSLSLSLTLAPLLYQMVPMDFGLWRVDNKDEAAICCMIGVVLLLLSFHLVNGLAYLWGRFAQIMLGADPPAGQ